MAFREIGPFGESELDAKTITAVWYGEFSATTGTVTAPTGGTLIEEGFASDVDALCSTVTTTLNPDLEAPTEADGTPVTVSSFTVGTGAFTLSGTPSAYPVSVIFAYTIPLGDYDDTKNLVSMQMDQTTLDGVLLTDYSEAVNNETTTANITIDLADGNVQRITLDAIRQITLPSIPASGKTQSFVLIIEPATFAPTWNSSPTIEWLTSDGAAPTLVTAANLINVVTFIADPVDSRWLGFLAGTETA